jgi:hypothetical protein
MGKVYYKKYVETFDPFNPSEELVALIGTKTVSSSDYIAKALRKKPYNEMTVEEAAYVGYQANRGTDDGILMARMQYFILIAREGLLSREEVFEMLYDDDVGIKIKQDDKPLVEVVEKKINPFG